MGVIGIFALVLGQQAYVHWQPRTKLLLPDFVRTAQFLLKHGLGDPRGCEFHLAKYDFNVPEESITLAGGNSFAWVLPDQSTAQKQVITPFGISVAARSVGTFASPSLLLPRLRLSQDDPFSGLFDIEDKSILNLFLLAIHGEEEIVAKALQLLAVASPDQSKQIPIQALTGYKFALNSGALNAYGKGDDAQAFSFCNQAIGDLPDFEKIANELQPSHSSQSPTYPFSFLHESMAVQKQILLRGSTPGKKILRLSEIDSKSVDEQVARLIEQLPEMGNPKSPEHSEWSSSGKTMKGRLIEIGQPAVPRLLAALATDDRITRAQPMYRSGPSKQLPRFVSVRTVVQDILRTLAFGTGNSASIPDIQTYWQANLGKTEFQRIYETLVDDSATWRWKYAALDLLQPSAKNPYIRYTVGSAIEPQNISVRTEMRKALGQSNPSVSDLLLKRVSVPYENLKTFGSEVEKAEQLLTLAITSYYIKPDQSLPALKLSTTRFLASLSNPKIKEETFYSSHFGTVIEIRKRLGDQTYVADLETYADFLRSTEPKYGFEASRYFIERLDDPAVARLAKRVFFDPSSQHDVRGLAKSKPIFVGVLASDLLSLTEGRALANELLEDTTVIDPKVIDGNSNRRMVVSEDGISSRDEPTHKYTGLRVCDLAASSLTRVKGCPEFNLEWSPERRDRARRVLSSFVSQLGSRKLVIKDRYWLSRMSL